MSSSQESLAAGYAALEQADATAARHAFERAIEDGGRAEAYEGLGWAAQALDDGDLAISARQAAFRHYRQQGDDVSAARMAMWLGKDHEDYRGENAIARGWRQRARRLLEDQQIGPEHGWLPILECWAGIYEGDDPHRVQVCAQEALAVARECGDTDIAVLAIAIEGLALVEQGSISEGMLLLDEAAAAAFGGELRQEMWGLAVFCFLIFACERARDFGRAAEWCEMMREAADRLGHVGSQAICRAHYGAVLTVRGAWEEAESILAEAVASFEASWRPRSVEASIRLAGLWRRQGRTAEAASLLREAGSHPLAILELAGMAFDDGSLQDARELAERYLRHIPPGNRLQRAPGLELLIRIAARSGDFDDAVESLTELEAIAETVGTFHLRGSVSLSRGVIAAAISDTGKAQVALEDAVDLFEQCGAPYEAALARVELADLLLSLGRQSRAQGELDRARETLDALGADAREWRGAAVLQRADTASNAHPDATGSPILTGRQADILRLVSLGMNDREIAERLVISEHTVHRHIANILARCEVHTRAAAVAYAASRGWI